MKIKLIVSMIDGHVVHKLYVDGEQDVYIEIVDPAADLIDGNDIISYIKMGYEAAKNNEELEIELEENED